MDWISIDERLPATDERVILYTPYPYFGTDNACIGDGGSISLCTTVVGGMAVPLFTHWMPLPTPPAAAGPR